MAPIIKKQKPKEQEEQKVNTIKVGKFEFKTANFWLTVLCFLMVLMLGMTSIISFTVYKVLDIYKEPLIQALVRIHQVRINAKYSTNQNDQTDKQPLLIQQETNQDCTLKQYTIISNDTSK